MLKLYKTRSHSDKIVEIEVERVTDKSYWINGNRNGRFGQWENCFSSHQEAVQYLIDVKKNKIDTHNQKISQLQSELNKLSSYGDKNDQT